MDHAQWIARTPLLRARGAVHSLDSMGVHELSRTLVLGSLLEELADRHGGWDLIDHWQQGEFHHDVVVRVREPGDLPGAFLVVATNCNGGVKEVLCFEERPAADALWHHRCPDNADFAPLDLPPIRARAITEHWFDPCALLVPDARSELREEHRRRQRGGGWCKG
jgi:hypothetical protein